MKNEANQGDRNNKNAFAFNLQDVKIVALDGTSCPYDLSQTPIILKPKPTSDSEIITLPDPLSFTITVKLDDNQAEDLFYALGILSPVRRIMRAIRKRFSRN